MQPFKDIRVLDLTHVLAGPFCTFQLGSLGADVIKIEPVLNPDMLRTDGVSEPLNTALCGTYFMGQNAGKRAIALDLHTDSGQGIFLELVKTTDVLVQNYAGDALARMGLDYDALKEVNPRLIYCSMSGFGQTGPKAGDPAYDNVIQAFTGMMAMNGWAGDAPLKVGPPVIDYGTGSQAATAISAALFQRERSGKGQFIDVAMSDAALMLMSATVSDCLASGISPPPSGNSHSKIAGYGAYETAEGTIMLGAFTNRQMSDLMIAIDEAQAAAEIRATPRLEIAARCPEDSARIAARMCEHSARHWEEVLNKVHVPAARVRSLAEALGHPQFAARNVLQSYGAPVREGAPEQLPVAAYGFAHDGPCLSGPPPLHGEHSAEVLAEIGIDAAAFETLKAAGVVG